MKRYLERMKVTCTTCNRIHQLNEHDVNRIINKLDIEFETIIHDVYASNKNHKPIVEATKHIISTRGKEKFHD